MSPALSIALGCVFVGLAFVLRSQPSTSRLGFIMMMMAGAAWFVAGALGFMAD